jgi:hypothetical protein
VHEIKKQKNKNIINGCYLENSFFPTYDINLLLYGYTLNIWQLPSMQIQMALNIWIDILLQSILDPHLWYVLMICTSLAPSFVIKNRKRNKIIAGTNLKFLAMFSLLVCTKKIRLDQFIVCKYYAISNNVSIFLAFKVINGLHLTI